MTHTAAPWQLLEYEADKGYLRVRGTRLGGRYKIANVHVPDHEGVSAFDVDESFDNAKFIVRACNAHNDLVRALQEGYAVLADIHHEWPGRSTADGQKILCDMRDAISKATGIDAQTVSCNNRSSVVRVALGKAAA